MNVLAVWWRSLTGLGPVFQLIFASYLTLWAVMVKRRNFAVARTLAAHVGLWGVVGAYVGLTESLRMDISGDGLKGFQKMLAFGPESSLVGLTLFLAMNLLLHFVPQGDANDGAQE
jgi:hypothetical protein